MLHDWKPSLRIESHCLLPVEMRKHRFLIWARSALVMKLAPLGWTYVSVCATSEHQSVVVSYQTLLDGFLDLLDLDFGEATDLEEMFAMLCVDSLWFDGQSSPSWAGITPKRCTYRDGVIACVLELQDVCRVDASKVVSIVSHRPLSSAHHEIGAGRCQR